jgi:hypothetical protein
MFLLFLLATIAFQPTDSSEQIDFLRISFKANKDSFAFGTFHFQYTRGRCASLSDAESGVFSSSISEDGLYVFDGKNERYDLLADPEALAAVTKRLSKKKSASMATAFRALTDGEVTLLDRMFLDDEDKYSYRSPEIYPGTEMFCTDAYFNFPLSLGNCDKVIGDLFDNLSRIKDGVYTLSELDLDSKLDGLPACKLLCTFKGGSITYWIDRSRGCLPIRVELRGDEPGFDASYRYSDFEHVASAGWLPRRRQRIWASGKLAELVVITKLDVTNRPQRSLFTLDFPKPVPLNNQAKQLVYAKQKTWSLLDLPGASSPRTRPAPQQHFSAGEMPGEIEPGLNWLIPLAGAIVLAVAGLTSFFWWRAKRRQVV